MRTPATAALLVWLMLWVAVPPVCSAGQPAALLAFTIQPQFVRGGTAASATITLNCPAPEGGAMITLTNNDPQVATVPAMVTIPAGSSSITFPVATTRVGTADAARLVATYRGGMLFQSVWVMPPEIASFTVSPSTLA